MWSDLEEIFIDYEQMYIDEQKMKKAKKAKEQKKEWVTEMMTKRAALHPLPGWTNNPKYPADPRPFRPGLC
jgi:hypothetical protein